MTALERQGTNANIWVGGEALIVTTLRRCHAAYSRGDFEDAATALHPDIELVPAGGQPPISGIEAVRTWMGPDAFAEQVLEMIDIWVAGNQALVQVHARVRGATSGIELQFDAWTVWTFNAYGLAIRAEIYLDREQVSGFVANCWTAGSKMV